MCRAETTDGIASRNEAGFVDLAAASATAAAAGATAAGGNTSAALPADLDDLPLSQVFFPDQGDLYPYQNEPNDKTANDKPSIPYPETLTLKRYKRRKTVNTAL